MSPRASLLRSVAAITLAAALAGCGGPDERELVEQTVEAVLTSTDTDDCTALRTTGFNARYQRTAPARADAACERDAPNGLVESAEASTVSVEGDRALARVAVVGGPQGGRTLRIGLHWDEDRWILDRLLD